MYRIPEPPIDPPEASVFCTCDWCGDEIYEGDDYYEIGTENVCANCIGDCCREAVIEKPMRIPTRMVIE